MKKLIIYYVSMYLILVQIAFAQGQTNITPCIQKSFDGTSYIRLCNNVEDIICKDVSLSERRSCDVSKQDVFRTNLTVNELGTFLKSCFGAAFTSFKQFFTEFIPDLLKGIWDLTKAAGETISNSVTGNGPSFWDKIKGAYESVSSVASDVYEAASSNPTAFMKKLMTKISDAVGPLVANFDCLKPELKVAKVCGFVGEWVVPPLMLAKMLVKGVKLVKAQVALYGIKNEKKIAQYAKAMDKMDVMAMKQMQFEEKFKALGYTKEEFDQIIKSGTLKHFNVEDLKVATSKDGWQQRLVLLGKKEPKKVEAATAATTTATKPATTVKPNPVPTQAPAAQAPAAQKPAAPVPRKVDLKTESFSVEVKRTDGSIQRVPGQVLGRNLSADGRVNFHVRVYDPVSGKMKEAHLTEQQFAKLFPKDEDAARVEALMAEGYKKNPQFKPITQEWEEAVAAQKKADEIRAAEAAAKKKAAEDQVRREFKLPDGITVEHIPPTDPRYRAAVGEGKYDDGIEFVSDPAAKNLKIVKEKDPPKRPAAPDSGKKDAIVPRMESNYITIRAQNGMGSTAQMSAQVLRVEKSADGRAAYVVKIWDSATRSFIEKKMSAFELERAGAKASEGAEKEFMRLKQQGIGSTEVNF